ncbi:guanylate kinase [Paenibacillus glufosinatiresistens]|uniref:guanylate kinase n=1 Tax=Paenibacillus glufosinatiresistens TaxID=3070657 RepID=UPI00286E0276|nr:hypothetical protein [Paenibacillus sp. YX.27]
MGQMFILYGPSASGKTEIQRALLEDGDLERIITATSRPPRPGEANGVHYHFMDRGAFQQLAEQGGLVEYTRYNGEYYGTPRAELSERAAGERDAVVILELNGVRAVKKLFPLQTVAIYIGADPASLRRRLEARGGSADETASRLRKALEEETAEPYLREADAAVWNRDGRDLADTVREVREVIEATRRKDGR